MKTGVSYGVAHTNSEFYTVGHPETKKPKEWKWPPNIVEVTSTSSTCVYPGTNTIVQWLFSYFCFWLKQQLSTEAIV